MGQRPGCRESWEQMENEICMVMEGRREGERWVRKTREVASGFLVNGLGWRKASPRGREGGEFCVRMQEVEWIYGCSLSFLCTAGS